VTKAVKSREERRRLGRRLAGLGALGAAALALASPAQASVTRTGTLEATVTDDFRAGESNTRYTLRSGDRETVVRPTELAAEPGDRVAVTGTLRDGRLVGAVEATSASPQPAVAPGPRNVAVLLITFGASAAPWSKAEARAEVFTAANSVSAFYEEESYGGISLKGKLEPSGDVFGWFALDTPTADCQYEAWKDAADAAAAAQGIDLTGYQHLIYEFPYQSSCSWLGTAALAGDWAMVNGDLFGVRHRVTIHELGHNLGLLHAGSWTCTSGGSRVQISDTCTVAEYGDPFDAMGNIAPRHNSGWNLEKLGILTPQNVETVEASGTYSMRSALDPTAEPTVLRVPRTETVGGFVTSWYFLEVREKGGVFENVADASTTGVSIRATTGQSAETLLLDANPTTSSFGDAPLKVGQTFDGGPVRITTLAAGGGSATVSVYLDEEPPTVPDELQATVGADGVRLSWVSADDVGVERYLVFRDGERVGSVTTPTFLDADAPAGDHDYAVVAEDTSGNQSEPSEPLTVTVPVASGPTCADGECKLAFRYSGAVASWTVPAGVHEASLTVEGAGGGGGRGGPERLGGVGARIWATLEPLAPGQVAEISVGGQGQPYSEGGAGGFNGGGDGGYGGGGGGYTKLELDSTLEVLAAGGGGGGLDGANGTLLAAGGRGGAGGEQGSAGTAGGQNTAQGATLQGGGKGLAGGAGGGAGAAGQVAGSTACSGGAHAGSAGASGASFAGGGGVADGGGGGGGGYAGGGQGGGGAWDECDARAGSGGGGGGSSFVAPGRLVGSESAGEGDGWLSIEYDNPVSPGPHSYTTFGDRELDVPADLGVLSGGSTPDGVSLSAALLSPPSHGSLTVRSDGSFTYAPEPGFLGTDSFGYRATDPAGNHADATVGLNVAGPPSAAISSPAGGATYAVGQIVPTEFSCGEGAGGTGLSSCDDSTGTKTASGGSGRLDTATAGSHAYTVTAVSKTGLTGSASFAYTVVPNLDSPQPPGDPKGPEEPRGGVDLSLAVKGASLRELVRTGRVVVTVKVRAAATVLLSGSARDGGRGRGAPEVVTRFKRKTARFGEAGERKVTLVLPRGGADALGRTRIVRLTIVAVATGASGETARRRVASTLRR